MTAFLEENVQANNECITLDSTVNNNQEPNRLFSNELTNDIISISSDMEDEVLNSKFYNFQCIILYGYIDYSVATEATQAGQLNQPINHLINTPLELYETPHMAKLFTPITGNRQLMAFAVYVQDSIFDEFDLSLEERIRNTGKTLEEIRKSVSVIRNANVYKKEEKRKARPYISYTIQNQNAIKQIFPI